MKPHGAYYWRDGIVEPVFTHWWGDTWPSRWGSIIAKTNQKTFRIDLFACFFLLAVDFSWFITILGLDFTFLHLFWTGSPLGALVIFGSSMLSKYGCILCFIYIPTKKLFASLVSSYVCWIYALNILPERIPLLCWLSNFPRYMALTSLLLWPQGLGA